MQIISSLNLILLVVTIAINLVLAFIVYSVNPKNITNRIFSCLAIIISIWLITMHFSLRENVPEISIWLIRFSIFLAVPMTSLFFLFAESLPQNNIVVIRRKLALVLSALTGVVMAITLSPYAFTQVVFTNNFPDPTPGPAISAFGIFIVFTTFYTLYVLVTKLRNLNSTKLEKKRTMFVMLGILLMYVFLIFLLFLPVALLKNTTFVSFFPVYTLFFTGLSSYSIVRHGLFDLKIIATEVFTLLILVILFSQIFISNDINSIVINSLIFISMVVFGILLVRSVRTETKQKEKLQELTLKLEELDKRKDEFLNVAAHELRAPMTAIKGYLSMVEEGDAGKLTRKQTDFIKEAVVGNERLIRLVNNMLNISRIEEGRLTYEMGTVKLSEVVKIVHSEYNNQANEKKLTLNMDIQPGIKDKVYVDKDRIFEVVSNLVSNGIKYTDAGTITMKLSSVGEHIKFEVIDTGPGISKEESEKLFQKFYRAQSSAGKAIGTGLGLYICKLLVEKFSGQIGFSSELGKGSNFWFELPLKK